MATRPSSIDFDHPIFIERAGELPTAVKQRGCSSRFHLDSDEKIPSLFPRCGRSIKFCDEDRSFNDRDAPVELRGP